MRRLVLLALSGMAACGDNMLATGDPLGPAGDLVVVAHQDDDLLFMQPDVLEAVRTGGGVTSVYVTAGNGTKGADASDRRYEGLRSAYGAAAGSMSWHCGYIEIIGHVAEHCRLTDRPVSLVFLAFPDGGKQGEHTASLLHLWQGEIPGAETVAHRSAYYDRDGLIDTVAQIIRITQPARVRTLEIAATHGRDHSDHMLVGALTVLAMARASSMAELFSYRGYSVADEPANKTQGVYDESFAVLAHYEACVGDCAACGDACTTIDQAHVTWLQRRYAIGFRPDAAGQLRSGAGCLGADGALTSCETAPIWQLDAAGELRGDTTCVEVQPTGAVSMGPCIGGREHRFFADDEGHLWSGMPPATQGIADYAHLWCLVPTPSGVTAQPCGADQAPRWEFVPPTVSTPRTGLNLTSTGRAVRLGDLTGDGKADLCAIEAGGLWCAAGDGVGAFRPAVQLDDKTSPLTIDPRSLTLGDVDGDGRLDACGRDTNGVVCLTATTQFKAQQWTPSFNEGVVRSSTSASLTAIDANADGVAEICGVDMTGVVCAPHGLTLQPTLRSAWPSPMAVVWPADLDGDQQADWCAATDSGAACAVEAQRDVTTDGSPWGFSQTGMVDVAPANSATVAISDIDGDGRADLCAPREDRIVCARSQGRAFGPRTTTIAILPNQSVASALWLGDLDGDGRDEPCVDTGTDIVCAIRPSL